MNQTQAKDLFQLQAELVDVKVDMAVSKAIDRVLDRIDNLESGMNKRFIDLDKHVIKLEQQINSNDDRLKSLENILGQFHTKFIEYGFRAAAFIGVAVVIYVFTQLHIYP